MNDLATRRNVTTRLEELEDSVAALVIRADALLQAGKALSVRVAQLEDRVLILSEELAEAGRVTGSLAASMDALRHMTVLQRLRWVIRG